MPRTQAFEVVEVVLTPGGPVAFAGDDVMDVEVRDGAAPSAPVTVTVERSRARPRPDVILGVGLDLAGHVDKDNPLSTALSTG